MKKSETVSYFGDMATSLGIIASKLRNSELSEAVNYANHVRENKFQSSIHMDGQAAAINNTLLDALDDSVLNNAHIRTELEDIDTDSRLARQTLETSARILEDKVVSLGEYVYEADLPYLTLLEASDIEDLDATPSLDHFKS